MKIVHFKKEDLSSYDIKSSCEVFTIHVQVNNVNALAQEMIKTITDTSWIEKLDSVGRVAFDARSQKTIKRLVDEIFLKVKNVVTSEFGEYMISNAAQYSLENKYGHTKVPIAELLKEKVVGNAGFDFHTESATELIVFGESKYSGADNPHGDATSQILEFINDKKDLMDLDILRNFVSPQSLKKAIAGVKAYVAAFSINSTNPGFIFKNALISGNIKKLLCYPELYLIGIQVCA